MPVKINQNTEQDIIDAYNKHIPLAVIQTSYGITRATIYNILKRNNLKPSREAVGGRIQAPITARGIQRLADWYEQNQVLGTPEYTLYLKLGLIASEYLQGVENAS